MAENFNVFDFALTDEDMDKIAAPTAQHGHFAKKAETALSVSLRSTAPPEGEPSGCEAPNFNTPRSGTTPLHSSLLTIH
jgi:hypothetical protein